MSNSNLRHYIIPLIVFLSYTSVSTFADQKHETLKQALELIDSKIDGNIEKGAKLLISLAETDCIQAYPILADLYMQGMGVKKDSKEAAKLFRRSALTGNLESQNNMGWLYANGIGVEKDHQKAFEWYSKASTKGLRIAQHNLAECYRLGRGTKKDFIEATDLYIKAANQNYIESQFVLGQLYAKTQPIESFKWYRKAADNGHAMAQYETANSFLSGTGVSENPASALDYFTMAAKQDHAESTFVTGKLIYQGYGTDRNQQKGISIIMKASSLGSSAATKTLPTLSVRKFNLLDCLQNASEGNINSILDLGWNYFEGTNIGKNNVEAYAWFNLAAEFTGDKKHIWTRSFIARQLDVNDLIDAKKRASQISKLYSIKSPQHN